MKRNPGYFLHLALGLVSAALIFSNHRACAQGTAPIVIQVPFSVGVAGNGSTSTVTAPCSASTEIETTGGKSNGDGCVATQAIINDPYGATVDSSGNVYFADEGNNYVRVVYNGGTAAAAMITAANATHAGLVPAAGHIYALAGGLSGSITITNTDKNLACGNVAGNPDALDSTGDGCPATETYINSPYGATSDSAGDIFVIDRGGSTIHVVYAGGALAAQLITLENPSVTTPQIGNLYLVAGGSGGYKDSVLATSGEIHEPGGLAVDSSENLYIADVENNAIRMVNGPNTTAAGVGPGYIHTIGGDCTSSGCTALAGAPVNNVPAVGAAFLAPQSLGVDAYGNVYIADDSSEAGSSGKYYPSVRVIYAGGATNPAASLICLENGSTGYGSMAGSCSASTLTAGYVYAVAGSPTTVGATTGNGGLAAAAQFARLTGLGVDKNGNIYVGDYASPSIVAEINAKTGYILFLASDGQASSGTVTPGSYCAPGATSGLQAVDAAGDGCPGPQSYTHHVQGDLAVDSSGNVYFSDDGDYFVRKLTFNNSFPASTVGNAATQQYAFNLLPTTSSLVLGTPAVVTQGASTSEFVDAGTGDTCTNGTTLYGTASASQSTTCVLNVTFTPTEAGPRAGAVQIAGPSGVVGSAFIDGIGQGAALAIDPANPTSIGAGTAPQGVAIDAAGNTYIAFAGTGTLTSTAGSLATTPGTGLSQPYQVALDGAGNVYVADSANNRIAEFAVGSSTATTAVGGLSLPEGVALDAASNLYIADTGNAQILFQPAGNGQQQVVGSGFMTPVAVAVDASDNVYVADTGLGAIVKIAAGNGTQTTLLSGISPVGLAVDAAGDLEYVDSALKQVIEIPVSGMNAAVVTGLTTPIGVALDASGGLYIADASASSVSYYSRTSSSQAFPNISTILSAQLTNIGNENYVETNGTYTQSDSSDFSVTSSASNGCNFTDPLTPGENCAITAQFTPEANGPLSDTVSFAGNAVNAGSVPLDLSGTGEITVSTTTTLGTVSPASPVYGQAVQVPVTVTATSGTTNPSGSVTFTVDGVAQTPDSLTNGTYTLSLTTLGAGQHTISATYAGQGSFSGSTTASPLTFTVAPLAITATAASVTSTYGQPLPTISGSLSGVLPGDQGAVSPVFSTTATSTSPVGSYPITVALTGSAAANYTVTLTGSPTVTVQPATVTLTVTNATKVYGAANPTFTGTFTGVLTADQANVAGVYSTTATANSVVGNYPITATGLTGSAAANYKLGTVTPGTLSVTPLALTTTATSVTATYGQAIPALTGTPLSGLLPQDVGNVSAVFATTATATSPVGSYPISVTLTGSAAANYTVTLTAAATVTIQPASVAVTVNNATRVYGAANPAFSGVVSGVLPTDAANVAVVYTSTATSTSAVGTYPITASALSGSAAGNYKVGTVTAGTLTITQAGTTTTLTSGALSVNELSSISFTATVASSTSGTPSGSVNFMNGSTVLGTASLINGVATFSTVNLPYGSDGVTAVYGGSTDFSGSTSSAVNITVTLPVVNGTLSASTVTIQSGSAGTVTLTATAEGAYIGSATYSCYSLPADMTCSFSPASSTFSAASTTATSTLTISTTGSTSAMLRSPVFPGTNRAPLVPALALCLPGAIMALCGVRRLKMRTLIDRRLLLMFVLLAGCVGAMGLTGCGSSTGASSHTAAGTYNINVQITAGTVQSVPLTVVVQ